MRITVSGPIGSGKSTVARLIAKNTGFEYFSGGDMFRKRARDKGMSIEEFNVYAEKHPEIDREQDRIILEYLRGNDNIVFDSRLSGWLAHNNGVNAFKIFIKADLDRRVSRVIKREGGSPEQMQQLLVTREASERRRYLDFYSINIDSTEIYDLVIETDDLSASDVAELAIKAIREVDS